MGTRKAWRIPAELQELQRRFEQWRETRQPRTRIPEPLWAAAVKMAQQHGLHRTVRTLALDYYALKKRMEAPAASDRRADDETANSRDAGEGSVAPAFLELPSPLAAGNCECVLELEDADGLKLRLHLRNAAMPDLVALSRSFRQVTP